MKATRELLVPVLFLACLLSGGSSSASRSGLSHPRGVSSSTSQRKYHPAAGLKQGAGWIPHWWFRPQTLLFKCIHPHWRDLLGLLWSLPPPPISAYAGEGDDSDTWPGSTAQDGGLFSKALPGRSLRARLKGSTNWEQVRVLLAFKAANLDPSGVFRTWKVPNARQLSRDPHFICSWAGVTCDSSSWSVTSLNVSNLDGQSCLWPRPGTPGQSIPPGVGKLTALESLLLHGNGLCQPKIPGDATGVGSPVPMGGLAGTIPDELGACTRLTLLDLGYNNLTGTIPETLSRLTRLQYLDVGFNNLCCSIPGFLGSLRGLSYLSLTPNNFSGPVPGSLAALKLLTSLSFQLAPISGPIPAELGSMPKLVTLEFLETPFLSGSLPQSLSRLGNLQNLRISGAPGLLGPIPAWATAMTSLAELSIAGCSMGGSLPTMIGNGGLTSLRLTDANITGSIPTSLVQGLCRNSALQLLKLMGNELTGSFPLGLGACVSLQYVDVSNNRLRGSLPAEDFFRNVSASLTQFAAAGNRLTGTVPVNAIGLLPSLQSFDVGSNRLVGKAPYINCSAAAGLVEVSLRNNSFEGDLEEVLSPSCATFSDMVFDLSYNRFSGSLPTTLADHSVMKELRIQGNNLTGALVVPTLNERLEVLQAGGNRLFGKVPASLLQRAPLLTLLDLSDNAFSGRVPAPVPRQNSSSTNLRELVLRGNRLTGGIPPSLSLLRQLESLDLSKNDFTSSLPTSLASCRALTSVTLANNALNGTIPSSLASLASLVSLSLSNNQLSGPVPLEVAPPNLPQLLTFNLSHNLLSGSIPQGFASLQGEPPKVDLSFNNFSGQIPLESASESSPGGNLSSLVLTGNPFLCGGAEYPPCPMPEAPSSGSSLSPAAIAGIAAGASLGLLLIGGLACFLLRERDPWSDGTMLLFDMTCGKALTARTILEATESFSERYLLGTGGFGSVYKASLPDGTIVAVKRLSQGSSQGDDEFKTEIKFLGTLSHRNLVHLIAAYVGPPPFKERLLVYPFFAGGSLDHVFVRNMPPDSPFRSWKARKRIALGVARGLKYLHHECIPLVIHRDMKPANVLLNPAGEAHVADFGLAMEADLARSHMTADVLGTVGYVAPEYALHGHFSTKSDVYAFGVTLLRIVTGRQPMDVAEHGVERWIRNNAAAMLLDENIDIEQEDRREVQGALLVTLLCLSRVPIDRPSMAEIVLLLERLEELLPFSEHAQIEPAAPGSLSETLPLSLR